jgi:hypothetical protein
MSVGANSIPANAKAARRSASAASGECEWRLPSGEDLISFALAVGFAAGSLAEPIMGAGRLDRFTAGLAPGRDHGRRS